MYESTVRIDGMMCGMCEAHINDTVRKAFPDARKVSSSHTKGITTFQTEAPVNEAKLKDAIDATGYTFVSMESAPVKEKRGFFHRK